MTAAADVQAAFAAELLDGRATRFRTPGETAWLRHGDAVAPLAVVKEHFGDIEQNLVKP